MGECHPPATAPRQSNTTAYGAAIVLSPVALIATALVIGFVLQLINHLRSTAVKRKKLAAIPVDTYSAPPSSSVDECAICLTEFANGDKIRMLPQCRHQFHVKCIDKWLLSRCSCPTCRCGLSSSNRADNVLEMV